MLPERAATTSISKNLSLPKHRQVSNAQPSYMCTRWSCCLSHMLSNKHVPSAAHWGRHGKGRTQWRQKPPSRERMWGTPAPPQPSRQSAAPGRPASSGRPAQSWHAPMQGCRTSAHTLVHLSASSLTSAYGGISCASCTLPPPKHPVNLAGLAYLQRGVCSGCKACNCALLGWI